MKTARIEDIAEFVLDGTHGSPVRTDTGIPVLSAQNVKNGSLSFETDRYTTASEYDAFERRLPLKQGDLLLTIVGTIGRAAVLDEVRPLVFQRSVAVIRPKPDAVWPRFLFHASQTPNFQGQMRQSSNQSSQAGVYLGKLKDLRIPVPPLPAQRRIAEVLDRAEALQAKRRAALAQLDTLSQSIFLDMFGDPRRNPKTWPERAMGDVCEVFNDCPHSTPSWTDKGVICLRTSNLSKGGWNWEDTRYVSEVTYHVRSRRGYVLPGDIVLSREGTVGVAAVVQTGMKVCMGQRLVQVRPQSEVLTAEYLLRHLLHVLDPIRIGQVMVGSTSQHLNVKELRGLRIPLPPIGVQREFVRLGGSAERLKTAHRASLALLDALFASLQYRAFHGAF